jgi:hypothetical protein
LPVFPYQRKPVVTRDTRVGITRALLQDLSRREHGGRKVLERPHAACFSDITRGDDGTMLISRLVEMKKNPAKKKTDRYRRDNANRLASSTSRL